MRSVSRRQWFVVVLTLFAAVGGLGASPCASLPDDAGEIDNAVESGSSDSAQANDSSSENSNQSDQSTTGSETSQSATASDNSSGSSAASSQTNADSSGTAGNAGSDGWRGSDDHTTLSDGFDQQPDHCDSTREWKEQASKKPVFFSPGWDQRIFCGSSVKGIDPSFDERRGIV
ncbi:MAG: hypothetical protein ABEN55_18055 [Bradymonadaceae bacterium]